MRAVAKILRARASEQPCNFCAQFEQRPNCASTFKLNETILYPFSWSQPELAFLCVFRFLSKALPAFRISQLCSERRKTVKLGFYLHDCHIEICCRLIQNTVSAKIYYDSNGNNDLNSNSPTKSSFLNNFAQKKGEKHNLWKHRQSFLKRSKVTRLHKCCDLVLTQLDNFVVLFWSDDI